MKTVHFVVDRSPIVEYLVTPLRLTRDLLRSRGYEVRLFYGPTSRSFSCDILGLVSKPILKRVGEKEPIISKDSATVRLLNEAAQHAGKVIWFDSSDSTGVTHFELLPYVDLYLKKQLLKDREQYRREMYGGRIFSDYYHRHFRVRDSIPFVQFYPLQEEYESKVDLSWNMGLGELYHAVTLRGRIRGRMPNLLPPRLDIRFADVDRPRSYDVFLSASANWARESVVFHRKELLRRLHDLVDQYGLSGYVSSRTERSHMSMKEYRRRMGSTRIAFGPFGWGELNLREYEALMFGALLLRPDISHMQTWPDIFIDRETCVFYRWDFSDLEEKILHYLNDDVERVRVAEAGQRAYREAVSESGMRRFSDWFIQQIEA